MLIHRYQYLSGVSCVYMSFNAVTCEGPNSHEFNTEYFFLEECC